MRHMYRAAAALMLTAGESSFWIDCRAQSGGRESAVRLLRSTSKCWTGVREGHVSAQADDQSVAIEEARQ